MSQIEKLEYDIAKFRTIEAIEQLQDEEGAIPCLKISNRPDCYGVKVEVLAWKGQEPTFAPDKNIDVKIIETIEEHGECVISPHYFRKAIENDIVNDFGDVVRESVKRYINNNNVECEYPIEALQKATYRSVVQP